jgi:gamma-glutamyltranspeptidase / glutathione hydrolase
MKKITAIFILLSLVSCAGYEVSDVDSRRQAAIASAHPLATKAGEEILAAGGNAFDAAVAVTAALAVVEPYSSGIGGGGFWLLHREKDNFQTMIDGRERAPLNAHRDMYLDENGQLIKGASINGAISAGIPGVPAAMEHLAKKYGNLSLAESLKPAIRYAQNGFEVDEYYQRMVRFRLDALRSSISSAEIFLQNNNVPEKGFIIKQLDLANTLGLIASEGRDGFYKGKVAEKMIAGVRQAKGIWTIEDLEKYQIIEREPVRGQFKGMNITSAAPPSSGGIALVEIFNQLSDYSLSDMNTTQRTHYIVEAMRRAYRDRAEYLGDTDFVDVPVQRLISKDYAAGLTSTIHPKKATPSALLPGILKPSQGTDTTHFSILDHEGNRVSATLSINYPFGSCFVAPGTGVLLNDEMDDFSAKPGEPNVYGLVGAEANAIEPGKRMLSSMSPTFLETEDRIAIIGTPGGSRIITMVMLGALAFYENEDASDIVNLPRFHHQYLPDKIFYERNALAEVEANELHAMGHSLDAVGDTWGNMQLVIWDKQNKTVDAASDARGLGSIKVMH